MESNLSGSSFPTSSSSVAHGGGARSQLRNGLPMRLSAWLFVGSSGSLLVRRAASYVQLDGEVLSIHADQFSLPSDEVDLRNASVEFSLNRSSRRDFRVVFGQRSLSFRCDSFEQMKTWATSIEYSSKRRFEASYTIGGLLSQGSSSKVFAAHPRGDDSADVFAVKVVKRRAHDMEEVVHIGRERRVASSMPPHPNIVRAVDVFSTVDRVHIVMELMRGGTLGEMLERHPRLPEPHAKAVMRNLFAALVHLHANHVVHRDIRPENVFCSERKFPMELALGDFGDANFVSDMSGQEKVNRDVLSSMAGDPAYMATEIVRKQKYGPAVDLWSAGVLMYRILSGGLPFTGPSTRAMYDAVVRAEFSMEGPAWDPISSAAKSLIRQLLQPDPHKRISAVAALHHHWLLPTLPATGLGLNVNAALAGAGPSQRIPRSAPPPSSAPFGKRHSSGLSSSAFGGTDPRSLSAVRPFKESPSTPALSGAHYSTARNSGHGRSLARRGEMGGMPSRSTTSSSTSSEEVAPSLGVGRSVGDMIREFENGNVGTSGDFDSPLTTDGSSSSLCVDDEAPARARNDRLSRNGSSSGARGLSPASTGQDYLARQHSGRSMRPVSSTSSLSGALTRPGSYGDMDQPRLVVTPSLRKIHEVGLHEAAKENPTRISRILSNRVMKQQLATIFPGRRKLIVTARAFIAVFRMLALARGHSLTRQLPQFEGQGATSRAEHVNDIVDKRKAVNRKNEEKGESKKPVPQKVKQTFLPRSREEAIVPDRMREIPSRRIPKLLQRSR